MPYNNVSAILAAVQGGASHNNELECLVVSAANKFASLSGGVWSLADSGDKVSAAVFNSLASPAAALTDPPEYEHVINAPSGYFTLVSSGGYCARQDP